MKHLNASIVGSGSSKARQVNWLHNQAQAVVLTLNILTMTLPIYQVDAFTNRLFGGNPAAVVPLDFWLPDKQLQSIAEENNLSETAFFVASENGFHIRWFTPVAEVDLCGHATLATAHVLWNHLNFSAAEVSFKSKSGQLKVAKEGDWYTLDFPTDVLQEISTPSLLTEALKADVIQCLKGREDLLVILESEEQVLKLNPDFEKLKELGGRGVICSSQGTDCDFVSRCFFPCYGINEDPVTGSAHTTLTPFWAQRLKREKFIARQISRRGGALKCSFQGERTLISGQAVTYLTGNIFIDS